MRRRKKTILLGSEFSKYDPTVPILVGPRQITGLNDRNLIGNAFLTRLEHFGVRQDISDAAKAMRATKIVAHDDLGDATVGAAIDRSLAMICDIIVDEFQALPPETWESVAVRFGCLAPCEAVPVPVARAGRSQTSVAQNVAGRATAPVKLPLSEVDAFVAVAAVAEILRTYDSMSMRACNVVRGHLGLADVSLEKEEHGVSSPMNRSARRTLGKLYERAASGVARDLAKIPDPAEARESAGRFGAILVPSSLTNPERTARQIARGRTIRIFGYDSRPPASGKD